MKDGILYYPTNQSLFQLFILVLSHFNAIQKSFNKLMRANYYLAILASILLFSCKKETEEFQTEPLSTYLPTQAGKYITYRTDSTLFTNFGATTVIRSYQEKHEVNALTTDNIGRPSYRVFRYIRDTAGTTAWKPSGSYFITPLNNTVELVENNLRYVKLISPVKEGGTWQGNRFLPTDPYGTLYDFNLIIGLDTWNYTYESVGESFTYKGKTIPDVITVEQANDVVNIPATTDSPGYKERSVEKYAKGVGLIYQELILMEYQPTSTSRSGYRGFGVKRSIIDHN